MEGALEGCIELAQAYLEKRTVKVDPQHLLKLVQMPAAARAELAALRRKAATLDWICGVGTDPEAAREELSALRADSRELAAMREGGVWLPRVARDATVSTDDYFLVFNSMWKQWRAVRLVVKGTLPLMDCETAYGPLPHEGRDDGE